MRNLLLLVLVIWFLVGIFLLAPPVFTAVYGLTASERDDGLPTAILGTLAWAVGMIGCTLVYVRKSSSMRVVTMGLILGELCAGVWMLERPSEEEQAWTHIGRNEPTELEEFMTAYPKGRHAKEARAKLGELENVAWRKLASESELGRRLGLLDAFLDTFGSGSRVEQAQELREETQWQLIATAKPGDLDGKCSAYLRVYPEGKHVGQARAECLKHNK